MVYGLTTLQWVLFNHISFTLIANYLHGNIEFIKVIDYKECLKSIVLEYMVIVHQLHCLKKIKD
jgi:hypothetical protein